MMKAKESDKLFVDRKWSAAIADDGFTGAVIEGFPNMASSSRDYVFAVAERTSLGQPHQHAEEAGRSHDHHLRARASVSDSSTRCILDPR